MLGSYVNDLTALLNSTPIPPRDGRSLHGSLYIFRVRQERLQGLDPLPDQNASTFFSKRRMPSAIIVKSTANGSNIYTIAN